MMAVYYSLVLIALVSALLFLIWPWIEESHFDRSLRHSKNPLPELNDLFQQKEFTLEHLKDLELDHQMGKLIPEDYAQLKSQVLHQSLSIERAIEKFEKANPTMQEIEGARRELSGRTPK